MIRQWCVAVCALVCVSCGGGGGGAVAAEALVGPSGGTIELPNGSKIEIPPGALASEVLIRLAEVKPEDLLVPPGDLRHSKVPVAITPHGTTFMDDVRLTLPRSPSADPKVVVRLAHEGDGLWKIVPHDGDDGENLTVNVRKLSVYSIFEGAQPLMPGRTFRSELPAQALEAGDVDGDGDFDVIVGQNGGTAIFLNDGTGVLEGPLTGPGTGNVTALMGWDADASGHLSALWIGLTGAPDEVHFNDPVLPGTFTDSGERIPDPTTSYDTTSVSPPAFNEFFGSDLILTTTAGGAAHLYEYVDSVFLEVSPPTAYPSVVTAALMGQLRGAVAEVDILFGTPSATVNPLWENDGMGTIFDAGNTGVGSAAVSALAAGDVDGDGDLDVYVGTPGTAPDELWLFDDVAGTYSNSGQALGLGDTKAVVLADLDGDGDLDAYSANGGPDFIYWNDGSGTFTESALGYGDEDAMAVGVKAVDLDGDDDLDVVVVNTSGLGYVWLQD